jgi:hypothetical protein
VFRTTQEKDNFTCSPKYIKIETPGQTLELLPHPPFSDPPSTSTGPPRPRPSPGPPHPLKSLPTFLRTYPTLSRPPTYPISSPTFPTASLTYLMTSHHLHGLPSAAGHLPLPHITFTHLPHGLSPCLTPLPPTHPILLPSPAIVPTPCSPSATIHGHHPLPSPLRHSLAFCHRTLPVSLILSMDSLHLFIKHARALSPSLYY